MTRVAILGLGEAGRVFASGLAGHAQIAGWDPVATGDLPGIEVAADAAGALGGASAVLAFTASAHSADALETAVAHADPGTLYADFATADPALKRSLAARAATAGLRFADAAIMAPVRRGAGAAPVVASGDGAPALVELLAGGGIPAEIVEGGAGAAAARKLLRSILVKGLTAVMIESLRAAEAEGLGEWFGEHLLQTLTGLDREQLAGFVDGTSAHAARRVHEMQAAAAMSDAADTGSDMSRAAAAVLRSVAERGVPELRA
ncbi:MAG: NAD(P)-dependent oxidoreductase [Microbacteriaceae bacterium]|nr:NAD(P)-dependent oxidoreductase [Microbacteriaceae bacterium]